MKEYLDLSIDELIEMSHKNEGWIKARERANVHNSPEKPCTEKILHKDILAALNK